MRPSGQMEPSEHHPVSKWEIVKNKHGRARGETGAPGWFCSTFGPPLRFMKTSDLLYSQQHYHHHVLDFHCIHGCRLMKIWASIKLHHILQWLEVGHGVVCRLSVSYRLISHKNTNCWLCARYFHNSTSYALLTINSWHRYSLAKINKDENWVHPPGVEVVMAPSQPYTLITRNLRRKICVK